MLNLNNEQETNILKILPGKQKGLAHTVHIEGCRVEQQFGDLANFQ